MGWERVGGGGEVVTKGNLTNVVCGHDGSNIFKLKMMEMSSKGLITVIGKIVSMKTS